MPGPAPHVGKAAPESPAFRPASHAPSPARSPAGSHLLSPPSLREYPRTPAPAREQIPSAVRGEGLEFQDLLHRFRTECVPQVPILLESQPEIGSHPCDAGKAKCRVGRDAASGVDDFVEPREGDAKPNGEGGLGDAQGPQELLHEHFPGMGGRSIGGEAPANEDRGVAAFSGGR